MLPTVVPYHTVYITHSLPQVSLSHVKSKKNESRRRLIKKTKKKRSAVKFTSCKKPKRFSRGVRITFTIRSSHTSHTLHASLLLLLLPIKKDTGICQIL